MPSLLWSANDRMFAVDVRRVIEVCPVVRAQPLPSAPPWLLGLFDWHGELLPLLDAGVLTGGAAIEPRLGSRTLLIEAPAGADAGAGVARFGLRVEQTIGLRALEPDGAWNPAGGLPGLPHLRDMCLAPEGRVQHFDCARLAHAHAALLLSGGTALAPVDREASA
jgi:chemotaxis-related protein WspB